MSMTTEEISASLQAAERVLAEMRRTGATLTDASDLAAISRARDAIEASNDLLDKAVAAAKANGRTWDEIGFYLGMSRQQAHRTYAARIRDLDNAVG